MKQKEPKVRPAIAAEFRRELQNVVTVPEICRRWKKSRKAVINQIYTEGLIAEQQGKVYLVHIDSVILLWGDPKVD